jgi:hypothetical protein
LLLKWPGCSKPSTASGIEALDDGTLHVKMTPATTCYAVAMPWIFDLRLPASLEDASTLRVIVEDITLGPRSPMTLVAE